MIQSNEPPAERKQARESEDVRRAETRKDHRVIPPRSFSTNLPAVQALESVVNAMLEGRDKLQRFAAAALPVSYDALSLQGLFPSLT